MDGRTLAGESVLVTGGAGFVGSHIAHALAPHTDVTIIDDLSNGRRECVPAEAEFVHADLRTMDTFDEHVAAADVVFHEPALHSVERSVEDPLTAHEINTDATLQLLEAARRHDTRIVTASSAAIDGVPEATTQSDPIWDDDETTVVLDLDAPNKSTTRPMGTERTTRSECGGGILLQRCIVVPSPC